MTKIETFLRGEYWLHFVTMFFAVSVLMWAVTLPMWVLIAIVVVVPVLWELFWKIRRQIPIEILDILLSIAGGVVAILI